MLIIIFSYFAILQWQFIPVPYLNSSIKSYNDCLNLFTYLNMTQTVS